MTGPRGRTGPSAATPSGMRGVTAGYGDRIALDDVDLDDRGRLAPRGHRPERRRQEHAAQDRWPGCSRPWPARSRCSARPPGGAARRVAYVPQAELVDWDFPVTVGDVVMMGRVPARSASVVDLAGMDRDARATGPRDGRHGRPSGTARSGHCPAASGGGSSWPGRSPRSPSCTCSTSPSPASMRRPRRTSWTCSRPRPRAGKTVIATTHDLACCRPQFQQAALINGRIVAIGAAETWSSTSELLADDVRRPRPDPAGRTAARSCSTTPITTTRRPTASAITTRVAR